MKKQILFGITTFAIILVAIVCFMSFKVSQKATAQENPQEKEAKIKAEIEAQAISKARSERDAKVTQETIDKVLKETDDLFEKIAEVMKEKMPKWKLTKKDFDLSYGVGKRGTTFGELGWKKSRSSLLVQIYLNLNKEDANETFETRKMFISRASIEEVKNLGSRADLIKSVAGHGTSAVTISLVKGRAIVDMRLFNFFRSSAKNEKEVREIAEIIAPLIVVRDSFDQ